MVSLDLDQAEAVESNESMVVIAGPGSGKTRVITEKARKEFNSGKNILCLTFTRNAAKEMQERVHGLPACTIHSYCCGSEGWQDSWGYDGLLRRFLWNKYKTRFDWVLVDECQDLNELEMDVILSIVGDKVFAVGDPYQSIYGFQGAMGGKSIEVFSSLGASIKNLRNNYRSCETIVDNLNFLYDRQLVSKGPKDVGKNAILCRTNDDLHYLSRSLKNLGFPHTLRLSISKVEDPLKRNIEVLGPSNLSLSTIHSSKGLEFDSVGLFGWKNKDFYGEEKRVFYVAHSRASKVFKELSTLGEVTDFLEVANER